MKLRLLISVSMILAFAAVPGKSWAQCKEMKWPEDRKKADECVAVYTDAMKQGLHRQATASWRWMFTNAPKWNTKLYIDGADIYDKLAEKETDPAMKQVLIDSLLWVYDQRLANCGDEANVLNRKAYAAYKYNVKNKEKQKELLALYDRVFDLNGNSLSDANLVAYMTTIRAYQISFKDLTDEAILARYDKIMTIIDAKIKKATEAAKTADVDKLKGYKDAVDGLLIQMVKVNCDFVRKNLAPKFKATPTDLVLAKKIFKFMLDDKCTDDPLWLEAGEAIYKLNPEKDFGLLKTLAGKHLSTGNYDKAESLLKEAMAVATTPADKAEAQLYMGSINAKKGDYAGARDMFRQAANNPELAKDAWEKIGDLYYNSFSNCKKNAIEAEDRLVFIAAYEMYQKAGNQQLMAKAKTQFPSKEDIFLPNWQAGSIQKVGCWINESVTLRTRD